MSKTMTLHNAGQFAQSAAQTKTARWMRWQKNRFTSATQQMLALADRDVHVSRSTACNWRAGSFPEAHTLIDLVASYPSLHTVFWPELQSAKAASALAKFDKLEADLAELRAIL